MQSRDNNVSKGNDIKFHYLGLV